jgi:hypothetical protein
MDFVQSVVAAVFMFQQVYRGPGEIRTRVQRRITITIYLQV